MSWWSDIWKQTASDWTYAEILPDKTPNGLGHDAIVKDTAYLNVKLRSMRIVHVRKGLSKFYGTVHSFVSVPYLSGQPAVFHVITTPGDLQKIDAENIDRILVMDKRLLGPIPYRGGDVEVELGLFSIKEADLAAPFLHVLESMSKAAGVTFLNVALPFAEPLKEGINLLAGADKDSVLEIGLSKTYFELKTGYFAVMRAAKGTVDTTRLRVDNDQKLVEDQTGKPIADFPYVVFSIESSRERENWFEIPDIATAYNKLREVARGGNVDRIKESLSMFRLTTLYSPDLLLADARTLVQKVQDEIDSIYQPSGFATRGRIKAVNTKVLRKLNELELYGPRRHATRVAS